MNELPAGGGLGLVILVLVIVFRVVVIKKLAKSGDEIDDLLKMIDHQI
jgi:hypothetical protein